MAERTSFEAKIIEGGINPRPEWRDPHTLDKMLVGNNYTMHISFTTGPNNGTWGIYSNESGEQPLVVAAYQRKGAIVHLFTNNPNRTTASDKVSLLADAYQVATSISESELYKERSTKENTARLLNTILGMVGGGVTGVILGAGMIYTVSKLFNVDIPIRYGTIVAVPPAVLLAAYMGDIRYERRAAQQVIDEMHSHPDSYLHGPPAVHLIESYVNPVTRRTATRIFDL